MDDSVLVGVAGAAIGIAVTVLVGWFFYRRARPQKAFFYTTRSETLVRSPLDCGASEATLPDGTAVTWNGVPVRRITRTQLELVLIGNTSVRGNEAAKADP